MMWGREGDEETTTTIEGGEVVSSSSSREGEGEEGRGTSLVVIVVKDKGAREERRRLREREGSGTLSVCRHRSSRVGDMRGREGGRGGNDDDCGLGGCVVLIVEEWG